MDLTRRIFTWGHRGAPELSPENTIPSFLEAESAGVDGIELDVQLSADGVPVVLHDARLDRTTTGEGYVGDFTWDEIRQLSTKTKTGDPTEIPVPRLEEVFDAVRPTSKLCIEFKNGPRFYPELVQTVHNLINRYHAVDRTIVSSFDHFALLESRNINPDVPRAVAWGMGRLVAPWQVADSVDASYLHLHKDMALRDDLITIRQHGLKVAIWGLKEANHVTQLQLSDIDCVFVDDPAWIYQESGD